MIDPEKSWDKKLIYILIAWMLVAIVYLIFVFRI